MTRAQEIRQIALFATDEDAAERMQKIEALLAGVEATDEEAGYIEMIAMFLPAAPETLRRVEEERRRWLAGKR